MIGARLILEEGSYFEGELFRAAQARGGRSAFEGIQELQIKDLHAY